jgi:hypothetical protein
MKVKENEEELAELRGYYEALLWMMQSENEVVSKRTSRDELHARLNPSWIFGR